jgi:VWFA-related protein
MIERQKQPGIFKRRTDAACQILVLFLTVTLLCPILPSQSTDYTFHAQTEVVLVNVTVRDKDGNFIRTLKPEDFTLLEDGKPQKVASFDIENTDALPATEVAQVKLLTSQPAKTANPQNEVAHALGAFKDRRMIILFFDLSAMEPDEIDHAATAAQKYVDTQMAPADLVSIVSLGSTLTVNQDFTTDKGLLQKVLHSFNAGAGQGFEEGSTGTTEGTADTGGSFTADDTEYNIFNTDRRLEALRSIAAQFSKVEQKKSLIYFSSGMDRTGVENQSELRAATNAAVRANLSIYTLDIRGLQALVPGGEAQNASLRGTSAYSGASTQNALNSNFSTQETLVTLAGDTGGRAYLDSNDFGKVFKGVQDDTSTYYMLGYHSSNQARDGRYRRITVKVNQPGLKIEYRRGYYAPADFKHSTDEDRERQLDEELASDLPSTDLPVYLAASYFRIGDNKFYMPVSVVVPGSEIPFTRNSDKDKATLDILGVATDATSKRALGDIRETVKLSLNTSAEVQRKNVQYNSGFVLPSGQYHLKFVVRENQTGRMGSFETDVTVPDLKNQPLKMSSVVLASQIQPAGKRGSNMDPLERDGSEVIPSVTHVFTSGQHLYLYFEVYDPARESGDAKSKSAAGIRILSNVAFFQGKAKVFETPLVETKEVNAQDRHAAVFQLDVPLTQLKPGFYTCQVNVIDDAAGKFLFPRLAMLVRQPKTTTAAVSPGGR